MQGREYACFVLAATEAPPYRRNRGMMGIQHLQGDVQEWAPQQQL